MHAGGTRGVLTEHPWPLVSQAGLIATLLLCSQTLPCLCSGAAMSPEEKQHETASRLNYACFHLLTESKSVRLPHCHNSHKQIYVHYPLCICFCSPILHHLSVDQHPTCKRIYEYLCRALATHGTVKSNEEQVMIIMFIFLFSNDFYYLYQRGKFKATC